MNNKRELLNQPTKSHEYFAYLFASTGYKVSDFESIIPLLNGPLHQKTRDANKTIRNKYTHALFHEVSKVPLMTNEQLLVSSEQIETI